MLEGLNGVTDPVSIISHLYFFFPICLPIFGAEEFMEKYYI